MLRLSSILLLAVLSSFVPSRNNSAANSVHHTHHNCTHNHDINVAPEVGLLSFFADREGTAAERTDAQSKVNAYRTANALNSSTQLAKNLGYVEGSITLSGVTKTFTLANTVIKSNAGIVPNPTIFTTSFVNGYDRFTDSEYQMLSLLAKNNYNAVSSSVFAAATGTLKIVSEREYCTSCNNVVRVQFKRMFPNVNLIFVKGWVL